MVPGTFNPDEDTPSFENWHGVVNKGTHIWVEEEVK